MSDLQEELAAILRRAAWRLRGAGLPVELAERMERLAEQVYQPCMLAVVGRVKVGKSTFVNALLGEDLAKVGTTETTATINYFVYGDPDPERPVRCHWRGGRVTDESREFLDGLQGNDLETLRRADGIEHLEYFLPNPLLKQITLVDTPGTGAVVVEHRDRIEEFMQLNSALRERHHQDTRGLNDTADAVIYLVGQVATTGAKEFLEKFQETTGNQSSALNAIGVLSKIELQPEVLARRHELSAKISAQLKDSLNTVLPVAAGLRREMDRLLENGRRTGLERLMATLRRIPPETLEMLLDSEEFFRDLDFPDSPVGPDERRELLGETNWGVFSTMARVAADPALDLEGVVERLEDITGFETLWGILNKQFIERGHILRCYRISDDAREMLNELRYKHLPERRRAFREDKARLERFIRFIRSSGGDSGTARELEEFVRDRLDVNRRMDELETLHAELGGELSTLFHQLSEYNDDFETLQTLEDHTGEFTAAELGELRALLGLHGGEIERRIPLGTVKDTDYVGWRQMYWSRKKAEAQFGTVRYDVAEQAFTRYGLILDDILGSQPSAFSQTVGDEPP